MKIKGIIWLDKVIDKLATKHNVGQNEVLEVLLNQTYFLLQQDLLNLSLFKIILAYMFLLVSVMVNGGPIVGKDGQKRDMN